MSSDSGSEDPSSNLDKGKNFYQVRNDVDPWDSKNTPYCLCLFMTDNHGCSDISNIITTRILYIKVNIR